jgi:hypothetical protein
MQFIKRTAAAALVILMIFSLIACDNSSAAAGTETSEEITSEPETESESETTAETETETTTEAESDTEDETTEDVTETEAEPDNTPENINPLTGLETPVSFRGKRPVAIMINNINISCPQMGVSKADIMYECLVEGGYTRLMMLSMDYENLPVVGSIRSARDYYVDLAGDHDAIYVHAGGSPDGYSVIKERSYDDIDAIYMAVPTYFYRDATRLKTMGYEHSLMTTGEQLAAAVKLKGYRTTTREDFVEPFKFVKWGKELTLAAKAEHIHCYFSGANITDFVYDKETNKYLRYQFNGQKHIDGETGEQLAYTNVLVLFNDTAPIPGDDKNRITYTMTGSGDGYYIYGGRSVKIKWSREKRTDTITLTRTNGKPLEMNRGNTFVELLPASGAQYFSLNYSWQK